MKSSSSSNTASLLTRRQALKLLGSGTCLVAAGSLAGCASSPSARSAAQGGTVVDTFPLTDVRLLDGPFLEAQKRDEAYLLKLEPDRMLHNFRVNAGLEPKAPIYGGWESGSTS